MEEITEMLCNINGINAGSSTQIKDNGTPFDAGLAADPDADSIFEERTPCGSDVMPVTVDRLNEQGGPLMEAMEYFMSIQKRCIENEMKYMVDLRQLRETSSEIREWHRNGIIDMMIDAQAKLHLNDFTLFLAVNIFDRCLAKCFVNQKNIYLVGITCLWIAHKYEEVGDPTGNQYVAAFGSITTARDIIKMEAKILSHIKYELTVPTAYPFLMKLFKVIGLVHGHQGSRMKRTAQFLISLALMDVTVMRYRPSGIAAAAVRLAAAINEVELTWDDTMEYYSGGWTVFDIITIQRKLKALWLSRKEPDSARQQFKAFEEKFKFVTW